MVEHVLEKYKDEIVWMIRDQRMSQAATIRFLQDKYDTKIAKGTFSMYVRSLPETKEQAGPGESRALPEDGVFLQPVEFVDVLKRMIDEITVGMANVHARLGVIEDSMAERHATMAHTLASLPTSVHQAATSDMQTLITECTKHGWELEAIRHKLGVPNPKWCMKWQTTKRWGKALVVSGLAWGAACVAFPFWPTEMQTLVLSFYLWIHGLIS